MAGEMVTTTDIAKWTHVQNATATVKEYTRQVSNSHISTGSKIWCI